MEDEREAWLTALIGRYETPLLRMCYLHLRDRQLAEDAVQETFFKAYRAYGSFRREASEKTWLTRIALNACRDLNRRSWRRHEDRRITPETLPLAAAEFSPEDEAVTLAVMRLPEKLREAVVLCCVDGLSQAETARLLRISRAAVSARLCRAREKLKDAWKEDAHD